MTVHLDTNALIRFFTNDLPAKAEQVEKLLRTEGKIRIADVVFPELAYVLPKQYNFTREDVVNVCKSIFQYTNIAVSAKAKHGVHLYETSKLDMADCLIAAHSVKGKLASFDRDLLKLKEVKPYWR